MMQGSVSENLKLLLITFFGFMLGGASRKKAEARLHLFEGKQYFRVKKWDAAWKKFVLAEHLSPLDPEVQFFLATTYFHIDRCDYALKHIQKFEQLPPGKKDLFLDEMTILSASISIKLGRTEECIQELIKMSGQPEQSPDGPPVSYDSEKGGRGQIIRYMCNRNLGNIFYVRKEFDRAIKYFDRAIKIEDNPDLHYSRGLVEFSRDNFKQAGEAFTRAIDKGYSSEDIYIRRAYSYFKIREFDRAKMDFRRVITSFPEGEYRNSARSFIDTISSF